MPTSPFLAPDGWLISNWTIGSDVVAEGIPDNGFQPQSILLIGLVTTNLYSLQWLDQNDQSCSVSGLQPSPASDSAATTLVGENLIAYFGLQGVLCNVVLTLDPETNTLTGDIGVPSSGFPDTGSGTFTATSNAGGIRNARRP